VKELKELQVDPYTSRPNCDIKLLKDTKPKKHRLRVGKYRIIYYVEKNDVKIIDFIKRELVYNRME
jgi:mRNA-degrading endonuclease RelE of RelBE toxin-antitoxin system